MEFVETEGDSVDEAIEKALKILGVERDKVEVEVLVEGRAGILGFDGKKACIRASLRKPIVEVAGGGEGESSVVGEKGREVLREILRLMGVEGTVEAKAGEVPEEDLLEIRSGEGG